MQKLLLLLSFLYSLAIMWWMSGLRKLLVIPEKKINALLSLELNWGADRVSEVVTAWNERNLTAIAQKMNGIDFLFILGYCSFLFLGVLLLKKLQTAFFVKNFHFLLSACILLAIFDSAEGIASIFWLKGQIDETSPIIISILSSIKFALVAPLLILVLVGIVKVLWQRLKHKTIR